MSESDRAAAEAALRRRDKGEGRRAGGRGMRAGLLYDESDDDEDGLPAATKRRRLAEMAAEGEDMDADDGQVGIEQLTGTNNIEWKNYF
jgi:hypothetical protein